MGLLTTMKGLPLAYNRDLQEDKEGLFDTVDTLLPTLGIMAGMIETMKVKPDKMRRALDKGYLLATDIADYLVKKGEAFREAHQTVGQLVSWAAGQGKSFSEINLNDYKKFSPLFEDDVYLITYVTSLSARNNPGATEPDQVKRALKAARKIVGIEEA
jgi:argininosuccinate lyase